MPSRKRAQGKNRKEKNEARGPVERDVTYHRLTRQGDIEQWEYHCRWGEQADNVRCSHGCVMPPRGHAVHNFMNTFAEGFPTGVLNGVTLAFKNHIEVLKDPITRKMVMDIFWSIGTNFILRGFVTDARAMAGSIILLEHYNGENHLGSAMSSAIEKIGYMCVDIDDSREKDTIHFYNKRIPCSCLKDRYSQVKKCQDRSSSCFRCKQLTNRKILMACGRCKYAQYCSKECQVADWPSHKKCCKEMCNLHKFAEKLKSDGGV